MDKSQVNRPKVNPLCYRCAKCASIFESVVSASISI